LSSALDRAAVDGGASRWEARQKTQIRTLRPTAGNTVVRTMTKIDTLSCASRLPLATKITMRPTATY